MLGKNKKNPHFLQKLANREISGNFIRQGKANSQNSSASKLFKTIPSRCEYQLSNVIDLPGNHVFMGTTRCGQFLLTYSFITHNARSTLSQRNKYQLHWWLFRPGRRAAKVAEVQLFADHAVTSILTIGIAQWPTVNQRLVVYGYCNNAEDYLEEDHRRYYLTITTLPSLDCRDCLTVAASFDEEDMAANWDSCVSLSCLKHGLTIHSLFDVTPPYPKFNFNISLKLNNSVVFNTVNFLHVLSFDLENPKPDRPTKNEQQTIVTEEINHRVGQIMTARYPKEYALPYDINKPPPFKSADKANPSMTTKQVMKLTQPALLPPPPPPPISQPQRTSSYIFHAKEKSSRRWSKNLAINPVSIRTKVWRRSIIDQAEKVYAFEESEDGGGCEQKFKWYRRKRLADKMYEFCSDEDDEDMENIRPPDKCGTKLPRYKYLSPPKVSSLPQKCDVITHADSTPFTKMIRNLSKNDTRYMIPNAAECCKRLMQNNWKTDLDSEIRHENNELNNSRDSLKSNSCSLDETCCDIRQRDMDKPVTIQIPPINVTKSNETGNLDESSSDKQQQQDSNLKANCSLDENSCDIQHRDMDKPVTMQTPPLEINDNNSSKMDEISGDRQQQDVENMKTETSCDIRHRDMDKPVTIQIPPIDLPFTVSLTTSTNTDVCNSSNNIVSNTSSVNSDTVSQIVSNSSPTNTADSVLNYSSTNTETITNCSSRYTSVSSVCNTPNDTVSNLKATFETSNINHDVRAIIADWEADSISSMSPQSEFSSSVTTCNSPKVLDYCLELLGDNCNERHMVIQRFLEIPPRFGFGTTRKNNCSHHLNHHRCPNITANEKVLQHSRGGVSMRLSSSTQYPPIKLRALQPHNRIRRSCFKSDSLLLSPPLSSCNMRGEEEQLKRPKKGNGVTVTKNELERRNLLLSPPVWYEKEERKKMVGASEGDTFEATKRRREGKMGCCSGGIPNKSEIGDSFEVKRRRELLVKVGSSGNLTDLVTDLKRKKKDDSSYSSSSLDEELFVDILDNMISDCSIQLDRRFIEVDEEMISTITDFEDDDQAVGFHCALPLHVHGSAYAQMQMVSNQKVDKLNVPCVLVRQNSLDIEQLCSKAAEVICGCEGFKFWFCDDYDTEIVEVCPLDGSVLIVVFMRLNVEQVNVGAKQVVVDCRHFYECKCLFVWSTSRQECTLETFTHLRPVPHDRDQVDGWSPARKEAERMRCGAETGFFHLQPAPAIRAFVHRLYDDDDNQTDSALEVQDPTNLMLFRLYPVNSNMKMNSNRIVVL